AADLTQGRIEIENGPFLQLLRFAEHIQIDQHLYLEALNRQTQIQRFARRLVIQNLEITFIDIPAINASDKRNWSEPVFECRLMVCQLKLTGVRLTEQHLQCL